MKYRFIGFAELPEFNPQWKEKCLSCANVRLSWSSSGHKHDAVQVITCALPGHPHRSASTLRLEGKVCGPEAKLWKPKAP